MLERAKGAQERIMNKKINIRISIFHQQILANVSIFVNFWVERSDHAC